MPGPCDRFSVFCPVLPLVWGCSRNFHFCSWCPSRLIELSLHCSFWQAECGSGHSPRQKNQKTWVAFSNVFYAHELPCDFGWLLHFLLFIYLFLNFCSSTVCLHLPPTTLLHPSHLHSPPLILPPLGFVHVSFIHVLENPSFFNFFFFSLTLY